MIIKTIQEKPLFIVVPLGVIIGIITAFNYKISILLLILGLLIFLFIKFFSHLTLFHYVLFLIPSIVLSPIISVGVGPSVRLDDLWLLFGALILIAKLSLRKIEFKFFPNKAAVLFAVFICWIVVTIFISSYREPYFYSNRDWFEVVKNLKLLIVLVIALNLRLSPVKLKTLFNVVTSTLVVGSLFGIAQYLNFANVNGWLSPYFVYETQIHSLEVNERIIGTFGNPNVFAGMLLMGIAISFTRYINEFKFRHLFPTIIFSISLLLTQSRTGLVCAVFLIFSIFFLTLIRNKRKIRVLIYSGLFTFVPFLSLSFAPDKFFFRMSFLSKLSTDNSLQTRINLWRAVFNERTSNNLVTGTGPLKELHYYFDNEWLMIVTTYGLMGLGLFLLLFSAIYFILGRISRYQFKSISQYSTAMQCLLLSYALYMGTLAVFQQLQMMPIIVLILGVVLSIGVNEKRSNNDIA